MNTPFTKTQITSGLWLTLLALVLAVSAARAQTQISCGQTLSNTISAPTGTDAYTLSGSAGQTLAFAFAGDGPGNCFQGYNPEMDLYNPSGQKIMSLSSCVVRSTNLTLAASGTYTILVHDDDYAQINSYFLSLQSYTGGGCGGVPISCGQTIGNATDYPTQMKSYSYVGSAGQTLAFAFAGDGPGNCFQGYNPEMDLYNPSGQKIMSLSSCVVRSTNLTLAASGTYTILVHDEDYANINNYFLSLQSYTSGGCGGVPISCGQTIGNATDYPTQMKSYSYVGSAGQTLAFAFAGDGPGNCFQGYNPEMDLYNPSGQKIMSLSSCVVRSTNLTLAASGTYTILVHDDDYANINNYFLSLQSYTGGGCGGTALLCGQTLNSQISLTSEIDALSLTASSGATAILSFGGFGGVKFDFYGPTGNKIFTQSPGSATNFTFGTAGTYTMLVHDDDYANTGNYAVTLTCIGCIYSISPTTVSVGAGATNGTVNVTVQPGCNWTATTNANWLRITNGASGSGNGTVSYEVDANPGLNPRTGTMTIGGYTFTVNQASAFNLVGHDIGDPGASGSFSYSNGVFNVTGSGEDIEDTADAFYFVHQPLNGDGQIVARVTSLTSADVTAEAGVMIRENLDAGAKHTFLRADTKTNTAFRRRLANNASSFENVYSPTNRPWLRLMRLGNTFVGHCSTNGTNWEYVWFTTVNISNQVQVGLAVTAHHNGLLATAKFDNVSLGALSPLPGVWPAAGPRIHLGGEAGGIAEFQRVGGFKMLVGGVVGDYFSMRGSADLGVPIASWPVLGTVTNTYGMVPFLDSQVFTNSRRFYRAQRVGP